MGRLSKTLKFHTDFSGFNDHLPIQCRQKDTSPSIRYFGAPSGYSQIQRKVTRDYELTPDFTSKRRRQKGIRDPFKSSIF